MSGGVNQILSGGLEQIIFNDFLGGDSCLPCVSKGWQAVYALTGENFRAQLELRDVESLDRTNAEAAQICKNRPLETVLEELVAEVGRKVDHLDANPQLPPIRIAWERILEIHRNYSQPNPGARDGAFARRLLICLNKANQTNDEALYVLLSRFLAQENLAKRAKSILQQPDSAFRHALYETQESFILSKEIREFFEQNRKTPWSAFSREKFFEREFRGMAGEYFSDMALRVLFLDADIGARVDPAPADDAHTFELRECINNPANTQALSNIQALRLRSRGAVPVEIRRLSGLTCLRVFQEQGRNEHIVGLPDEFGELQNLESLEFVNSTSFREIPPVLENLPALRRLTITGNDQPIRVFPSWLDDKINSGLERALEGWLGYEHTKSAQLDQFLGLGIMGRGAWHVQEMNVELNHRYAGLPREEFTDIPFTIWFRETITLPSSIYICHGLFEFIDRLANFSDFYNRGWLELIRALTFPLIPAAAFIGLLVVLPLLATLGLPSFIGLGGYTIAKIVAFAPFINPIIHNTVGRLAEAIYVAYQESIGAEDPRMIHVRDIPAAQPAVAQAPALV